MKKFKRMCSIILILTLACGAVSVQALAYDSASIEKEARSITLDLPFVPWENESELRSLEAGEGLPWESRPSTVTVELEVVDSLAELSFAPNEKKVVTDGEMIYVVDNKLELGSIDTSNPTRNPVSYNVSRVITVWCIQVPWNCLGSVNILVTGQMDIVKNRLLTAYLDTFTFSNRNNNDFRETGTRLFTFNGVTVNASSRYTVSLTNYGDISGSIGMSFTYDTRWDPYTWPS